MIAILCKWQIFCSFIDNNNLKLICINFNRILHPRFTHFITYVHDNITFENKICTLFKHEKIYFMFTLVIVNISIRRSIVNIYYTINSMRWTAFFNSKKTNPLSFYEKSNKSELDLVCIFFLYILNWRRIRKRAVVCCIGDAKCKLYCATRVIDLCNFQVYDRRKIAITSRITYDSIH